MCQHYCVSTLKRGVKYYNKKISYRKQILSAGQFVPFISAVFWRLCYQTVVYPVCSVCPVCNVGVLWPTTWMDQDETWHVGRRRPWPLGVKVGIGPGHIVLQLTPQKRHTPNFRFMSIVAKLSPISAQKM